MHTLQQPRNIATAYGFHAVVVKGRRMVAQVSRSLLKGARSLPRSSLFQVGLHNVEHTQRRTLGSTVDRGIGALRHARCVLTSCFPSRVQAHLGHIAEHNTARTPMLVSILINPRTTAGP